MIIICVYDIGQFINDVKQNFTQLKGRLEGSVSLEAPRPYIFQLSNNRVPAEQKFFF